MKKPLIAAFLILSASAAQASDLCNSLAIDKNDKAYQGIVNTNSQTKCASAEATCNSTALSKDGKPIYGAAKNSYVKKYTTDALKK